MKANEEREKWSISFKVYISEKNASLLLLAAKTQTPTTEVLLPDPSHPRGKVADTRRPNRSLFLCFFLSLFAGTRPVELLNSQESESESESESGSGSESESQSCKYFKHSRRPVLVALEQVHRSQGHPFSCAYFKHSR